MKAVTSMKAQYDTHCRSSHNGTDKYLVYQSNGVYKLISEQNLEQHLISCINGAKVLVIIPPHSTLTYDE